MQRRLLSIAALAGALVLAWWLVRAPRARADADALHREVVSVEAPEPSVAMDGPLAAPTPLARSTTAEAAASAPEPAIPPVAAAARDEREPRQVVASEAPRAPLHVLVRLLVVDADALAGDEEPPEPLRTLGGLRFVATRDPLAQVVPADALRGRFGVGRVSARDAATTDAPLRALIARAREFDGSEGALPRDCVARIELDAPDDLFVHLYAGTTVVQTQRVPRGADEVLFAISSRDLGGLLGAALVRVVRAQGAPFEGAHVVLRPAAGRSVAVVTGADGTARLEGVSAGWLELSILSSGCAPISERVLVLPRVDTDLGTYTLDVPAEIRGRTVDRSGRPVSVELRALALDAIDAERVTASKRATSEPETGEFVLAGLRRGRMLVLAEGTGVAGRARTVDTSAGDVRDVEIVVEPALDVSLAFDERFAWGALASLRDEDGLLVFAAWLQGVHEWNVQLAPGRYVAAVHDRGVRLAERVIAVGPESRDVRIER